MEKVIEGAMGGSFVYDKDGKYKFKHIFHGCNRSLALFNPEVLLISLHEAFLEKMGIDCHIWRKLETGVVCSCWDAFSKEARRDCPSCYGTGYSGGYEGLVNEEGTNVFKLRFPPGQKVVELTNYGFKKSYQVEGVLSNEPSVKNFDIVYWVSRGIMMEIVGITKAYLYEGTTAQRVSLRILQPYEPVYLLESEE